MHLEGSLLDTQVQGQTDPNPQAAEGESRAPVVGEWTEQETGASFTQPSSGGHEQVPPWLPTGDSRDREEPAWELRQELGYGRAFWSTIKDCLFHPVRVFRNLNESRGSGPALLFGMILISLSNVVMLIWNLVLNQSIAGLAEMPMQGDPRFTMVMTIVMIALAPVYSLIGIFSQSIISHFLLRLFTQPRKFGLTLRTVAYIQGATAVWGFLPLCGMFVYVIWLLIGLIIGFREVHRTTTFRAGLVVLAPMIVCCLVAMFGMVFLILMSAQLMKDI